MEPLFFVSAVAHGASLISVPVRGRSLLVDSRTIVPGSTA